MELPSDNKIKSLYKRYISWNYKTTPKYKKLLKDYNKLYYEIDNTELKEKFTQLEEIKNELYSEDNFQVFKKGIEVAFNLFNEQEKK